MSTVKSVGAVAAAGALVSGGITLYNGIKTRKKVVENAQRIADQEGGKIRTGGMTKDGKLWDGYTTVDQIKKDTRKGVAVGTAISAAAGAFLSAGIASLAFLLKAKLK